MMPPLRRKKKGEDDLSSDTSVTNPHAPARPTTTKPLGPSTSSNIRSNPLGNKATRPINSRNSPPPDSSLSKSPTKQFHSTIIRQNSAKQISKPQNRPIVNMAVVTPQAPSDRLLISSSPVSPVSPIAHEHNQISIREITPPSVQESRLIPHEESNVTTQALIPQTPGTEMRRQRNGARKISRFEKDRLIENIKYEVDRRAKALRQRYTLQAEMLRQSIELRVGRIPYKMRNMKMGDLYDQALAAAAAEEKMQVEAQQAVKEIEDVRRLSDPPRGPSPLKVSKKRALSPVKSSDVIRSREAPRPASPIKSSSPPRAIAPKSTIKLIPRTSPTQNFNAFPTSSPIKTVPFAKSMPTLKSKLASTSKPTPGSSIVPTPGPSALRTVASTIIRTPGSAAPVMKPLISKSKVVRGKAMTAATTPANASGPLLVTKKPSGRALRSRK